MTAPAHPERWQCKCCPQGCIVELNEPIPPNCGCLINSDIGAIWERASHSSAQSRDQVLEKAIQLQKDVEASFSKKTGEYNPTSIRLVQEYVKSLRTQRSRDP